MAAILPAEEFTAFISHASDDPPPFAQGGVVRSAPSVFDPSAFLRSIGVHLLKGQRTNIVGPLADGSGEVTVRYEKFGDMLAVLEGFDTLKAMAAEDPGRPPRKRPGGASSG